MLMEDLQQHIEDTSASESEGVQNKKRRKKVRASGEATAHALQAMAHRPPPSSGMPDTAPDGVDDSRATHAATQMVNIAHHLGCKVEELSATSAKPPPHTPQFYIEDSGRNEIADEEVQAVLDSYTGNYRSATDLATIPDMDHSIRGRWTLLRMLLLQEALLQRDEDHPLDETAQQAAQEEHLSNIEASSIVKVPYTQGCLLWTEVPDDWNVDIHDPLSRKNCMNAIST